MVSSQNPITQWAKGVMAAQRQHDDYHNRESLVVMSILSQKFHDWRSGPQQTWGYWSKEPRAMATIHMAAAHSTLKTSAVGRISSLSAYNHYLDKNKSRRDELIEKYHGKDSASNI